MLIGYARVSTAQQDTALQLQALKRAGVRRVVEEKASGAKHRPALEALLAKLAPGDVVLVYKIDRLARSLSDLLRVLQRIRDAGAAFRSLTEPIETATAVGRMLLHLLGAFAEFERSVIRERCHAGRLEAMARGKRFGRPPACTREQVLELRQFGLTLRETAEVLGVGIATVDRASRGVRRCDGGCGTYRRVAS